MYMLKTDSWYLERIIFLIAGCVALTSALLAWLYSIYWLVLTALVGVNLIIFATTGFCLMALIVRKLGAAPRLSRQ